MSPTHEGLGNWAYFQMTMGSMSLRPRRHNKLYYIILYYTVLFYVESHVTLWKCVTSTVNQTHLTTTTLTLKPQKEHHHHSLTMATMTTTDE